MVKKWVSSFVALLLVCSLTSFASAANSVETPTWYPKLNYVALGDSLAFGIDDNNNMGISYTDFLAQHFADEHILNSFSKGYTFPGFTTDDVLRQLHTNAVRIADLGINDAALPKGTLDAVRQADIITITAGANDLLRHVTRTEAGLTIDFPALLATQQTVKKNYEDIFTHIMNVNDDAIVYVMGYYNAFAHMPAETSAQAAQLIHALNTTIEAVTLEYDGMFVPTASTIAADVPAYLPNAENIHVSVAGYEAIASAFVAEVEKLTYMTDSYFTAVAVAEDIVTLSWEPPLYDEQVAHYTVYVDGEKVTDVAADESTLTVTNLEPSTIYNFSVSFTDNEGRETTMPLNTWELTLSAPGTYAFTDIATHGDRFYIDRAAHLGLVDGYADGTYRPSQQLTRAQVVKLLVSMLAIEHENEAPFTDIAGYAEETQHQIAAAYEAGLVQGSDGLFKPSAPVTRAQLALMLARAYTYLTGEEIDATPTTFSDIARYDEEAQQAIQFLYDEAIVSGWEGRYMPNNSTMRSHAAKMVVNVMDVWMK